MNENLLFFISLYSLGKIFSVVAFVYQDVKFGLDCGQTIGPEQIIESYYIFY